MNANLAEARQNLSDLVNKAAYGKERIALCRRGRKLAYIVPVEDVAFIERIEDEIDTEEGRKALEALRAGRDTTEAIEDVMEELGVKMPKK